MLSTGDARVGVKTVIVRGVSRVLTVGLFFVCFVSFSRFRIYTDARFCRERFKRTRLYIII